ncbi:unnamed protein product [Lactuca virosa]|uniref:Uncharacterized protein n=1 Tax=Lactuca virosa TaxID=75947 RepID=A0AAU9PAA4_9ASTR|nr:unnamed protein product [Lactuca virosa]
MQIKCSMNCLKEIMFLLSWIYTKAQEDLAYKEIPVGVILDMGSSYPYSYSGVGKAVHSCITMAVSEFYMVNPHFQTRIVLHHRDTHCMLSLLLLIFWRSQKWKQS